MERAACLDDRVWLSTIADAHLLLPRFPFVRNCALVFLFQNVKRGGLPTSRTQSGRGILQEPSPTFPPPAWKLMTACTLRPCLRAFLKSSMYARKSYCFGPCRSQIPHLRPHSTIQTFSILIPMLDYHMREREMQSTGPQTSVADLASLQKLCPPFKSSATAI